MWCKDLGPFPFLAGFAPQIFPNQAASFMEGLDGLTMRGIGSDDWRTGKVPVVHRFGGSDQSVPP